MLPFEGRSLRIARRRVLWVGGDREHNPLGLGLTRQLVQELLKSEKCRTRDQVLDKWEKDVKMTIGQRTTGKTTVKVESYISKERIRSEGQSRTKPS
jgi:hypothetical protein